MFDHIRAFHQPRTVQEALKLLHRPGVKACPVAGGTDLVLRAGRSVTELVDITRLGLDAIRRNGRGLRIGAAATLAALEDSKAVQALADGILAKAAAYCGTVQMRNVATVGGNLANASPAADTATPLLVLDAEVVLHGLRGKRRIGLAEFFLAPHRTAAAGALLTEIVIPAPHPRARFSLQRFSRTESDIAVVSVAAGLQLDGKGRCQWARVALGAVAPVPLRVKKTEAALLGQVLTPEVIERAMKVAAGEARPITDIRASAEYRAELIRLLLRRALLDCARQRERAQ